MEQEMEQEVKDQQSTQIGLWQAFAGVITSPGTTFEKISAAPMTWKPSLVLALLGILFTLPFYGKYMEYSRLVVKRTVNMSQLPAGTDVNQMLSISATAGAVSAIVGVVLGVVLFPIIIGALLKVLNFVMGEEAKFKQLWSVAVFSKAPSLIGLLLGNLLLLTASGDNLLTTLTLKVSLANLVPVSAFPPYIFAILASVDIFALWGMALLAIGTAKVFRSKALRVGTVVFGVWLAYVLVVSYFGRESITKLLS